MLNNKWACNIGPDTSTPQSHSFYCFPGGGVEVCKRKFTFAICGQKFHSFIFGLEGGAHHTTWLDQTTAGYLTFRKWISFETNFGVLSTHRDCCICAHCFWYFQNKGHFVCTKKEKEITFHSHTLLRRFV